MSKIIHEWYQFRTYDFSLEYSQIQTVLGLILSVPVYGAALGFFNSYLFLSYARTFSVLLLAEQILQGGKRWCLVWFSFQRGTQILWVGFVHKSFGLDLSSIMKCETKNDASS